MKKIFRAGIVFAAAVFFAGCLSGLERHPHAAVFDTVDAKLRPGIVKVRIKPEANPDGSFAKTFFDVDCPNCKTRHVIPLEQLIVKGSYLELPGFVMKNGDIIVCDPGFRSDMRFSAEAESCSGESAPVEIAAYMPEEKAAAFRTADGTLPPGAEPLIFKTPLPETPLFDYYYTSEDGVWAAGISPHNPGRYSSVPAGKLITSDFTSPQSIVTDSAGNPAALSMNSETALSSGRSRCKPDTWRRISAQEMKEQESKIMDIVRTRVYPVHFKFRPVDLRQERVDGNTDPSLEVNHEDAAGIMMPDGTMMVYSLQSPDMTARLASVSIETPGGTLEGEFVRALEDYNIIFVRPAGEVQEYETAVYTGSIIAQYGKPVWLVSLKNYGEEFDISVQRGRVDAISSGYKNIPELRLLNREGADYIFTGDGELLSVKTSVRLPVPELGRTAPLAEPGFVAAATLMLARDSRVISPKTHEERLQFDWIGIETRTLDPALAAAYSAAVLSENGERGLIISKVYPGTPAEKAGLKKGDILLSIADSQGRIYAMERKVFDVPDWEGNFIWDQYDSISEANYDQIPTPWVNQRTALNRFITQLGPEAVLTLNYARAGELKSAELQAEAAPPCFENAPRIIMAEYGLTVLDPTIEVRDYFRLGADEPGVLIARVRSGSKASVAGLMPYEIITAVNEKPVADAESFAAELAAMGKNKREAVLTVRRLGVSRLVTMRIDN